MHIELIGATATQPNTGAAAAAIAGDSLTVKNGRGRSRIISAWGGNQVAGFQQIAFPSAHDTTRGYRTGVAIGNSLVMPLGMAMPVNAQELLSITIAGSNVAGDVEQAYLLMQYDDVPGMSSRLISPAQLESRVQAITTIEASLVSTAGPSYGTPEAINADSDLLRANADYAVLGATVRSDVGAVYMVGPDTANVRIGVPGLSDKHELTSQWFVLMSRAHGLPLIPVINSGNKASTLLGCSANENAGTFLVTWHLALLK
jgi:hypothetical protein